MSEYALAVGDDGKTRLELLNSFYNPGSQRLLSGMPLRGKRVVEVGCGTGIMTKWLAEQVGPEGCVVAIDISDEQLAIARKRLESTILCNVEFICADAHELALGDELYDICYSRFLMLHMKNPGNLLQTYFHALKPNGHVICEEPIVSETFTYPKSKYFMKSIALYMKYAEKRGFDFDFGEKLLGEIKSVGFGVFSSSFSNPIITIEQASRCIQLALIESRDVFVEQGIATGTEIEEIYNRLSPDYYCRYDYATFHNTAQVIGRKPA